MTQEQDGAAVINDVKNDGAAAIDETKEQNGGQESDVQKMIEHMQTEIENLKREKAGETKKAAKLIQELKTKDLASKTAEEQLAYYKEEAEKLARKEAFRQSFKDIGLDPEDFEELLNETDPKIKAEKFAQILKEEKDKSAQEALEAFKKKELEKKGAVPNPKNTITTDPNSVMNNLIRTAMGC